MPRLLVFHPEFDRATTYLGYWARILADMAKIIGYNVTDLAGRYATRSNLEAALPFMDAVVFASHGMPNFIRDYPRGSGFDTKNNSLAKNKRIYALASLTGLELGPDTIRKGAKEYVSWITSPRWPASMRDPRDEPDAFPFGRFFIEIGKCFLLCDSAERLRETARKTANEIIAGLRDLDAVQMMADNRDSLVVLTPITSQATIQTQRVKQF